MADTCLFLQDEKTVLILRLPHPLGFYGRLHSAASNGMPRPKEPVWKNLAL